MQVEPPLISLIKIKNDDKLDKYFVQIKLRRDPTSENLDLYELKTALFDNGDHEELFLFIRNFNMSIEASGTLRPGEKVQYLCMLVHG